EQVRFEESKPQLATPEVCPVVAKPHTAQDRVALSQLAVDRIVGGQAAHETAQGNGTITPAGPLERLPEPSVALGRKPGIAEPPHLGRSTRVSARHGTKQWQLGAFQFV